MAHAPLEIPIVRSSALFPPGYGDFVLISNDGVAFHVPSFLLSHASGFFRDLFALPNPPYHTISKRLQVKENEEDLSLLLRCIDPNKAKPEIHMATIGKLLEGARFYQILSIFHWFNDAIRDRNLLVEHPMLILGLAFQLGLENTVRVAINELIECHISKWDVEVELDIPYRVIQYCRSMRDKRFREYNELIEKLSDFELSNTHRPKDTTMEVCMSCSVERAKWIQKMMLTAMDHPKWSVFKEVYEDVEECEECEILWTSYKEKPFEKWCNRVRPQLFESRLPVLPDWMEYRLSLNANLNPNQ